jgi:deazaflavin-dependent oxidoreductase (nitroreductase family)
LDGALTVADWESCFTLVGVTQLKMPKFHQLSKTIFRIIKRPPQVAYALGLGPIIGRLVLLLTTTGRVTGKPRVTPLQYEWEGDVIYVGAARGLKSDWVRNILANPQVGIRVKSCRFQGTAEIITDSTKIADYLEMRLKNHPRIVAAMLKTDGIPPKPTRTQLETYAAQIVLVAIHPFDA